MIFLDLSVQGFVSWRSSRTRLSINLDYMAPIGLCSSSQQTLKKTDLQRTSQRPRGEAKVKSEREI